MNPLPPSSRVPNLPNYNINKLLSKKTYIPNLGISRNVTPKIKAEENAVVKKEEPGPSTEGRRKPGRFERKLLTGTETFAPSTDTSRSRITIKAKAKTTNSSSFSSSSSSSGYSSSSAKKEIERESIAYEIPTKSISTKFAQISSALPQDLPVSVPRPRMQPASDTRKPISLLMDLFDPSGDESPLFILKTPKYLPASSDNSKNPAASTSAGVKNEVPKCTLHDFPEGQIGTLQIMKSGKLRMVLGECKFWLHRGVRVNFREELAYVNVDSTTNRGEIINIGKIKNRIIAVPENVTLLGDR